MKILHQTTAIALLTMASLTSGHAAGAAIYTENFNRYTPTPSSDFQIDTNLKLSAYGDVTAWTKFGTNALHAVDRGGNDWAMMLFDRNWILMNSAIAANASGTSYTVSFDIAAAVYKGRQQRSVAGDTLRFEVINSLDAVIASFDYATPAWTGNALNPFVPSSFTYMGNGSGDVRLRISDPLINDHFGGAIDNLAFSLTNNTVPEPTTGLLLLGGLSAIALMRRRSSRQV